MRSSPPGPRAWTRGPNSRGRRPLWATGSAPGVAVAVLRQRAPQGQTCARAWEGACERAHCKMVRCLSARSGALRPQPLVGPGNAGRTPILGRTVARRHGGRRATKRATETQTASHGIPPREMRAPLGGCPGGEGSARRRHGGRWPRMPMGRYEIRDDDARAGPGPGSTTRPFFLKIGVEATVVGVRRSAPGAGCLRSVPHSDSWGRAATREWGVYLSTRCATLGREATPSAQLRGVVVVTDASYDFSRGRGHPPNYGVYCRAGQLPPSPFDDAPGGLATATMSIMTGADSSGRLLRGAESTAHVSHCSHCGSFGRAGHSVQT